jgi:hypothetical protein
VSGGLGDLCGVVDGTGLSIFLGLDASNEFVDLGRRGKDTLMKGLEDGPLPGSVWLFLVRDTFGVCNFSRLVLAISCP